MSHPEPENRAAQHAGGFAEGEADPAGHPEEQHVGTFAEGEADPAGHPDEPHVGTFAKGEQEVNQEES